MSDGYKGPIRIVGRDESANVMELCRRLHDENGIFSMDDDKVRSALDRAFDQQGGILAGVGPKGNLHGLLYMLMSSYWYTHDVHWEELFLYVVPEHRKSRHAVDLIQFAKWVSDESNFPLLIGMFSDHSTERKEIFYERQLHTKTKGRFFLYWKNRKAVN